MFCPSCQVENLDPKTLRSVTDKIMIAEISTAEINGMSKWGHAFGKLF
jgi:hypothetical protein